MSATPSDFRPVRLTEQEWVDLDEDVPGELVDGVLVEEEVPDYPHEVIVMWLGWVLTGWTRQHGGIAGGSDAKFILRPGRGRKPDVSMYLPGSKMPPKTGGIRRAPDIMVEIISRQARDVRRDRIQKMDEYAAFGVRWYWLVDPVARTFEIYECRDSGLYARVVGASEGKLASVPGLTGLELDLDELWAKLDELPDEDGGDEEETE